MGLEALIWDVDGTLVDSEDLHRLAFNKAFAASGLDWHWDRQLYFKLLSVTGGKERIRHYMRMTGIDEARLPIPVEALHRRKGVFFKKSIQGGVVSLRPGVGKILEEAQKQCIRLAIATTASRSNIAALMESKILDSRQWEVIITGEDVKDKKPAPDVYLKALQSLGLEPRQCLVIEDSDSGLKASRTAGIPVVITKSRYTQGQDFTGALAVCAHLEKRPGTPGMASSPVDIDLLKAWHAKANE